MIIKFLLCKNNNQEEPVLSTNSLDLSMTNKSLVFGRILSFLGVIAIVSLAIFVITDTDYKFEWFHILFYLMALKGIFYLSVMAYSNEDTDIKIFKVESDRWSVSYDQGDKYILLADLKQIKIGDLHISFVPITGKIEMLKNLELSEEEKLQVKEFLENNLKDIEISFYESRLEIFKDIQG